jgi:hypothetical protein
MLHDADGMVLCRARRVEPPDLGMLMLTARGNPIAGFALVLHGNGSTGPVCDARDPD